ncbi:MAG: CBS domain-containing protein [Candidatus Syntrophoarchaeum sp. WYZ-LMO15]|nr:MAG: CBS domain-containing protein [Candidatus Syntrophoarchaeum sp. WYZ-LMO15]
MNKNPPVIDGNLPLGDLVDTMRKMRTDHVWVVEDREKMKLTGIITECDFLRAMKKPPTSREIGWDILSLKSIRYHTVHEARDLMVSNPITSSPSTPVGDAIELMIRNRVRHLAIVEEDRLTGEFTVCELINLIKEHLPEE